MNTLTITKAVVSGGYENNPVLYENEDGNYCSFRIGEAVYDKEEENNTRWNNYEVKVSGDDLCTRVKKMDLKKGALVSISGRFDIGTYEKDGAIHKKNIIWLKDIDFVGLKKKEDDETSDTDDESEAKEKKTSGGKKNGTKTQKAQPGSKNEGDTYYDPGDGGPSDDDVPHTPYASYF